MDQNAVLDPRVQRGDAEWLAINAEAHVCDEPTVEHTMNRLLVIACVRRHATDPDLGGGVAHGVVVWVAVGPMTRASNSAFDEASAWALERTPGESLRACLERTL